MRVARLSNVHHPIPFALAAHLPSLAGPLDQSPSPHQITVASTSSYNPAAKDDADQGVCILSDISDRALAARIKDYAGLPGNVCPSSPALHHTRTHAQAGCQSLFSGVQGTSVNVQARLTKKGGTSTTKGTKGGPASGRKTLR